MGSNFCFFSQSNEIKSKVAAPYSGYPYGWLSQNRESLAASKGIKTPPDLKESFNGGPLVVPKDIGDPEAYKFVYLPTLWPNLKNFRESWKAYYRAMNNLARQIMSAFAEALGLESKFFEPFIKNPISALRALHYPPTNSFQSIGQQRAGEHTDYGCLTILLPESGSKGLEIFHKNKWKEINVDEGCFIVNIGDLLARWTSDRWVSTLHRVVAKPNEPARKSLAFFYQADWDAKITPLDNSNLYPSVFSGSYLMNKFKSTSS